MCTYVHMYLYTRETSFQKKSIVLVSDSNLNKENKLKLVNYTKVEHNSKLYIFVYNHKIIGDYFIKEDIRVNI
jgi:hypothetical protein